MKPRLFPIIPTFTFRILPETEVFTVGVKVYADPNTPPGEQTWATLLVHRRDFEKVRA